MALLKKSMELPGLGDMAVEISKKNILGICPATYKGWIIFHIETKKLVLWRRLKTDAVKYMAQLEKLDWSDLPKLQDTIQRIRDESLGT